jgi:hypothetical protein
MLVEIYILSRLSARRYRLLNSEESLLNNYLLSICMCGGKIKRHCLGVLLNCVKLYKNLVCSPDSGLE